MKNNLIAVIILLFSISFVYPQEELVPNYLFLYGQTDVPSNTTITHTLTSIGSVIWELDDNDFPISDNSDLNQSFAVMTGSTTPAPTFTDPGAWRGFIFPWISAPYTYTDNIGYGFYKVTNSYNNFYFYLDVRDEKYSAPYGFPGKYLPDFYLRFDYSSGVSEWALPGEDWTTISNGEVLRVWEIKNNGITPTTADFENFWSNALVMTNNGSNHPRIVWGPYGEANGATLIYNIYRATSSTSTPPSFSNFSLISTVSADTYEFIDSYFTINGNFYVHYYVEVSYIPTEGGKESYTEKTNIVSTSASLAYKIISHTENKPSTFQVSQNYPNPFNPITKILYSIKEEGFVTLKVYDILGKEIVTLVNENKPTGTYEAEFNASQLPSGMYIYKIQSGSFTDVKKMLLTK
jgi:hypothetical protein